MYEIFMSFVYVFKFTECVAVLGTAAFYVHTAVLNQKDRIHVHI